MTLNGCLSVGFELFEVPDLLLILSAGSWLSLKIIIIGISRKCQTAEQHTSGCDQHYGTNVPVRGSVISPCFSLAKVKEGESLNQVLSRKSAR
jgi:hypothetical protein